MLHDIGRFEQVKRYNTFVDKYSVNHGELGCQILFEDGLIRKFVEDDQYDEVIKKSILNHNKSVLPEGLTKMEEKFSKVIRDADKTDIFYVLITSKTESCYEKADVSKDLISDEIYREFMEDRVINYKNRKSSADIWVSHCAYIFDFNYNFCLQKVKNEKYLERLLEKMNFTNEDTIKKANEIVRVANEYMDKQLNNKNIN